MAEETKDKSDKIEATASEPVRVVLDPASFSFQSVGRVVAITLILLFIAGFVQSIFTSLTYLFFLVVVSVSFAYLIDPLVKIIRRPFKSRKIERFMPRSLAILISYIVVFTVVSLGIANLAPRVVEQAQDFITNLPTYGASIQRTANDLSRRFDRLRLPEQLETKVNEKVVEGIDSVTTFITSVILGGVFVSLITYAPWLVLVPILAFFFLKDVNLFRLAVLRLFPAGRLRLRAESVMQDVNTTLAAYTRAQLISCFIIGVICTIGFYLIGLKYSLLLGILAGIFEFVPLLGPATIGLIVITTAGFSDHPWNAVYAAVFLIVLRLIHDYVTYPRIVRGGIHLHPVMIILSVLAGEQVAGIPGVFIAIPIVALITVVYRHVLEHRGSRSLFEGPAEIIETPLEENA